MNSEWMSGNGANRFPNDSRLLGWQRLAVAWLVGIFGSATLLATNKLQPVLLDWNGTVISPLQPSKNMANLYLVAPDGTVLHRASGVATPQALRPFLDAMDLSTSASPTQR